MKPLKQRERANEGGSVWPSCTQALFDLNTNALQVTAGITAGKAVFPSQALQVHVNNHNISRLAAINETYMVR